MKISKAIRLILLCALVLTLGVMAVSCGERASEEDKAALNEEIALEITSQGDYTEGSYNEYRERLSKAKAVLADENATKREVERALASLKGAKDALTIREVLASPGVNKALTLNPGESKEITISDYINTNGLSKISYEIKVDNGNTQLGEIINGRFTITAGEPSESADSKLSITVFYDNAERLKVELSVHIAVGEDNAPGYVPDDNIITDW